MISLVQRSILLLFLTRPVVLIPVWGFSLFGFRLAQNRTALGSSLPASPFLLMLLFSLSVAAVYLLNQVEDFDVDSENDGFPLMVKSGISKRIVIIFTLLLAIISFVAPIFLGNLPLALLALATVVIGILYSVKPTYFTGRPIFDFLSNGIGYGFIAFAVGWHCGEGSFGVELIRASLPYVLLMFAGSISSTLPDMKGDALCNKRTTAVTFGARNAHILALLFIIAGGVLGYVNNDIAATVSGLLSLPFYIVYLIKPSPKTMEATYKVGGGFMMLVIASYYPLFALISFSVGIITMLYFRVVHNVTYPALLPVEVNDDKK